MSIQDIDVRKKIIIHPSIFGKIVASSNKEWIQNSHKTDFDTGEITIKCSNIRQNRSQSQVVVGIVH